MARQTRTTNGAEIVTVTEHRQIARTIVFPADIAPYANWDAINETRQQLGSDLHVTSHPDGRLTVVFSWSYTDAELGKERS